MKKYVITSYIPGSRVEELFFKTLENYCTINNAELKVVLTGHGDKNDRGLVDSRLIPYLQQEDLYINKSLLLMTLPVSPATLDPTSGMDSIATAKASLILGAPKHRFKSVARSLKHNDSPRGIWCTGSISVPHYKANKAGLKAKDIHKQGALIVTVENESIFHIRQLSFNGQTIYDLDKEYYVSSVRKINPSAVVLGDLHPPFTNPGVLDATKKLLSTLRPQAVVYHDVFDAASISHHVEGKNLTKIDIHNKMPSLKAELELTKEVLVDLWASSPDSDHFVVRSNHDEHLDRYLDEGRFLKDYINAELAFKISLAKLKGENSLDASLALVNNGLHLSHLFMERDDTLSISGIECANHGDYGANGKHGSTPHHGLAFNGKIVTGHSHSPEIGVYGNVVVGTMTDLSLPYTNDSGTSGWLNTHAIIYPDGNVTHLHLIKRKK